MISCSFKTCFLIFAFLVQNLHKIQSKNQENFVYGVRYKSVQCESDNTTIMTKYCFLKPVSRKVVTVNVGVKLLVPYVKPIYGHTIVFYRYGTIFRQIIDTKKLEICSILDGSDTKSFNKVID
ncbi:hypothetical protein ACKWTF_015807 [Chironomus riparius]